MYVFVLLSHLLVSILALLSRELLEDCGQTAEHKDGTVRKGEKYQKFEVSQCEVTIEIYQVPYKKNWWTCNTYFSKPFCC